MTEPSDVTRQSFDQLMVPCYAPASFVPVRGQCARVWDQEGREYIDFTSGIAVNSLGHAHPELLRTLADQAARLWHVGNIYTNEPALRLAKKLIDATFAERVFFCNSGAEANEAALKLARRYATEQAGAEKHEIVSFYNSFHGRTLFTVTVGGQGKYTEGFAPLPEGIRHVPYNDLEAAGAAIRDRTCAVIVEPVQGEGGVTPADPEFLRGLRAMCNRHQALLVFDEVQIGMGRSGRLFAYMHYGVTPDILTSAKALGNGFPIGAMLTRAHIAAAFSFGTHGTTFGGNPLAAAVAGKVLELVNRAEVLDGVQARHARLVEGLGRINARHGVFAEVRGLGLLIGAALAEPWLGRAKELQKAAEARGLMVLIAGPNVVRFAPPLIIPEADLDEGLDRFGQAVAEVAAGGQKAA